MEGVTLKSRAIAFAFSIGATAFILALLATADKTPDGSTVTRAIVIALICGVMSWATAERALAGLAVAIDVASARIGEAALGDLTSSTPPAVHEALPELSDAMDAMFGQVRANLESAHRLAMFDPVTGLANRTFFRSEAERMLRGLEGDSFAALAFIDLDDFKAVNDTLGHAQGDQLLGKVANRLRAIVAAETVRHHGAAEEALVGRLAGDEFTVLFPRLADRSDAARLGSAMVEALRRPFDIAEQSVTVGASVGIAMRPDHGCTLTSLMRCADVAMYHAKAMGRDQYQFYVDALSERLADRSRLETELRLAVARDEFTMVYQPQVSLRDGRVLAAEGLLRWNHPTDGLKLPASFLGCAEDSGLIIDIGDWSIEMLARRVALWPVDALAPRLSVNLSPRQIARPEFFARLRAAFAAHKASMRWIEVEVSEAIMMTCGPSTLEQIVQLRADGARVAIDDFGAGFSSLARLRSLPVDQVKLDPSIVAGVENEIAARDILQAVIGLVHGLGATAVAEGVETQAQLDVLRVMGCDAAQGYLIAPPMTEADYRAWDARDRPALALQA